MDCPGACYRDASYLWVCSAGDEAELLLDAPKVALNGAAGKGAHGKAMPRVASNARLAEQGGTRTQLLGRCAVKAAMLGVIVHLLTAPGMQLPRLAQELLYGALTA